MFLSTVCKADGNHYELSGVGGDVEILNFNTV